MDPASPEESRPGEAMADVPQKPSRGHCCDGPTLTFGVLYCFVGHNELANYRPYAAGRSRVRSAAWCLFPESKVRAIFVVVGNVLTEQPFQMTFIEGDDVIE
jgi:hypothetical protein